MSPNDPIPPEFDRIQQRALMIGGAALLLCAVGYFLNSSQLLRSYLVGFLLWLAITLGCAAILMLHHLVGGNWGFAIRRVLESGARTVPLMALLFLPLLLSLRRLYSWARPQDVAGLALPPFKRFYLHTPFFVGRTVVYFVAWILLAYFLNKWSQEQDRTGDPAIVNRLQYLSGPGLLVYGFMVTYAAVDWVMSLEPDFFSTIFGMIFMVLPALAAMSFAVVWATLLAKWKPLSDVLTPFHFNDYGNLLLTFVMLWAYLAFDQFLIIWAGNLQDEIPWYTSRATGGWAWVAVLLIVFGFAIPFVLLLSRDVKRRMEFLAGVALALIIMEWVAFYWIVMPSFYPKGPQPSWTDLAAPIGIGGVWIAMFVSRLKANPLLPLRDPRFEGASSHGA
jgi:hypothetical protein